MTPTDPALALLAKMAPRCNLYGRADGSWTVNLFRNHTEGWTQHRGNSPLEAATLAFEHWEARERKDAP